MPYAEYTRDEVCARGQEIYELQIRPRLKPDDEGRMIVIDIRSGEYVIDDEDVAATRQALARWPDGVLYGVRVGSDAAYRLGGGFHTSES